MGAGKFSSGPGIQTSRVVTSLPDIDDKGWDWEQDGVH